MMRPHLLPCLMVSLLLSAAGCGSGDPVAETELPDWLNEVDTPSHAANTQHSDVASAAPSSRAYPEPAQPASPAAATVDLTDRVSFKTGERFPLRKVVEQELRQSSLDGRPQISRSQLELMFSLTVEDVQAGRTLMRVSYDRVKYSHDVAGDRVEFDSAAPPASLPSAVLAYRAMVNDGFAFWFGADHRVAELVGFREFVLRCLSHVSPEQQQQALADLEAGAAEMGVADFVDNTIGLLPQNVERVSGAGWEQTRHLAGRIPMLITNRYTLAEWNDRTAEVAIDGTISPSTMLGARPHASSVRIAVKGGSSSGRCTLDCRTGLPRHSRVERIVDMAVQMAGGIEFDQQQRTVTTIEGLAVPSAATTGDLRRFR